MLFSTNELTRRKLKQLGNGDWAAMGGSLLCAMHCSFQPILLNSIPILSIALGSRVFEMGCMALTFLLSLYALFAGYRYHRRLFPVFPALLAMMTLLSHAFIQENHDDVGGNALIWAGYLLLLAAHFNNLQLSMNMRRRSSQVHA